MDRSVEAVWETLHTRLTRFVRKRVPDEQTADDVLQDVYLKIHTQIHQLRSADRLQAWVYQITRNAIHDYYRSQKPTDELDELTLLSDAPDAADNLEQRLGESIRCMIESLPHDYREAVLLTEYEGLTQQALAERLSLSLSGAKSRVQRGRKLLRALMLECCHFQFDRLGAVIDYHPRCDCCSDKGCIN